MAALNTGAANVFDLAIDLCIGSVNTSCNNSICSINIVTAAAEMPIACFHSRVGVVKFFSDSERGRKDVCVALGYHSGKQ